MSIFRITINPGPPARFNPNPQIVSVNDSVFWFNADPNEAHWPAPSTSNPTGFIDFQIPPNTQSSQVGFGSVATIPYVCINHPGETGQIIVQTPKPASFAKTTKKGGVGGTTKKGAFGSTRR